MSRLSANVCSKSLLNNKKCKLMRDLCLQLNKKQGVHSNIAMRAAGFSYTGDADTARCDTCALEVSNWTLNMKPFTIHAQRSPKCEFVRSRQPSDITTLSPIHATIQCTSSSPSHDEDRPSKRQKIDPPLASMCSNTWVETETLKEIRRRTFSHWPKRSSPSVEHMIEAGFFSCNIGDRVICIYCNIICQQWMQYTDDPREVHRILSPQCPYVTGILTQASTSSIPILNDKSNEKAALDIDNITQFGHIVTANACHASYKEVHKRYASFEQWSSSSTPSVDDLVNAGFFYSGTGSQVTCFYCNGSLQNWGSTDNPKVEHARWFPHCAYVRQLCGTKLYRDIRRAQQDYKEHAEANKLNGSNQMTTVAADKKKSNTIDEVTLARFVAARLDLPCSQRLLDQNFKLSIIKRCWEDQLRLKNNDFDSEIDLFIACTILQKQIQYIDGQKDKILVPSVALRKVDERGQTENLQTKQTTAELAVEKASNSISAEMTASFDKKSEFADRNSSKLDEIKSDSTTKNVVPKKSDPCVLCLTEEKCLAFMPCGHVATCVPCGHSLRSCPMCRTETKAFLRVYL
ncbi:unnamed protein product [Adineta ricciae]|uniref:RING-type domain-containing protein n=1 Tax=Adineta ricciae TaxID=249248 RepID=A0A813ZZ40_ADIRI|nr:unnamed protein product [Adineta ricciae]